MSSVFDRLYNTETASSRQKKHQARDENAAPSSNPRRRKNTPKKPAFTTRMAPSSSRTKSGAKPKPVNRPVSKPVTKPVSTPKPAPTPAPPITTTQVLWSTKEDPDTFTPLTSLKGIAESLADYELGIVSARNLAICIVDVLFHREFSGTAPKWDIDSATAAVVENDKVFTVSKEATYNHKDIYSVASSKARIRFEDEDGLDVIRIEGYSYYVAG